MKIRVFWDVAPCSHVEVALMMEAVLTSETSVSFNMTTRRYIPEDSELVISSGLQLPSSINNYATAPV
jgi:hypothetical protein